MSYMNSAQAVSKLKKKAFRDKGPILSMGIGIIENLENIDKINEDSV